MFLIHQNAKFLHEYEIYQNLCKDYITHRKGNTLIHEEKAHIFE